MIVEWDTERHSMRFRFGRTRSEIHSMPLDENRIVEYAEDGTLIAVELPVVQGAVDLRGVPEAARIAGAITSFPHDVVFETND